MNAFGFVWQQTNSSFIKWLILVQIMKLEEVVSAVMYSRLWSAPHPEEDDTLSRGFAHLSALTVENWCWLQLVREIYHQLLALIMNLKIKHHIQVRHQMWNYYSKNETLTQN
jgi:hypothetical protein